MYYFSETPKLKVPLFISIILIVSAAGAQENVPRSLSPSLRECYSDEYLLQRDNRLPHTLNTLIAILRKIEDTEILNLQTLSIALLHRFRQDGIVPNPNVPAQDGVTPYAPNGFQFFKYAQSLRFIPGNALLFPNNSLSAVERCTLHFMLSSSIETFQRGDEAKVCRFAGAYRSPRSVAAHQDLTSPESTSNDVETLSPDEIEKITKVKETTKTTVDPNSFYPEYPSNHPENSQISSPPLSKCPVENGVVRTSWGTVSAGLVIAGIAAGLLPANITLRELQEGQTKKSLFPSGLTLDNKWLVTLAGDLAEVALMQGPQQMEPAIGTKGNWNSSALPRWYFLNNNEDLEYTLAEVKGGLDGLILASTIEARYTDIPGLRLSQVLDMYYSSQGLLDDRYRACNRRTMFTSVADNATISAQAYSAALLLNADLTEVTLSFEAQKKFTTQATNALLTFIPSQMNDDLTCEQGDRMDDHNLLSVDLTIILDTNWPFETIQPLLGRLLDYAEINRYNSNFTLLNAYDGTPMIESTHDILELFHFNSSHYKNFTSGFDLPKALEKLYSMQLNKMNREREQGVGGGRSNVVLILPYRSSFENSDKDYCLERIARMREVIPDMVILIATPGSKDAWTELFRNSETNLFSIGTSDTPEGLLPLNNLITRMKQVPKRLINTQCGGDYASQGISGSFDDYVLPNGVNFYKLHPNYFYNPDTTNTPIVKVEAIGAESLTVCSSREPLHVNTTENKASATCASVKNDIHSISLSCGDAYLIHACQPLYLSVTSDSKKPSYICRDPRVCRFPTMVKYTISYENLVCVSGGHKAELSIGTLLLIVSFAFVFKL